MRDRKSIEQVAGRLDFDVREPFPWHVCRGVTSPDMAISHVGQENERATLLPQASVLLFPSLPLLPTDASI